MRHFNIDHGLDTNDGRGYRHTTQVKTDKGVDEVLQYLREHPEIFGKEFVKVCGKTEAKNWKITEAKGIFLKETDLVV
jgi:hypothetical protein